MIANAAEEVTHINRDGKRGVLRYLERENHASCPVGNNSPGKAVRDRNRRKISIKRLVPVPMLVGRQRQVLADIFQRSDCSDLRYLSQVFRAASDGRKP